jgi:hypothetical protein
MPSSACSSPADALHHTPAVQQANAFLWQRNPSGGGVLVRNVLDTLEDEAQSVMKDTAKLLPASFLHASLRPSNAVFDKTGPHVGIGILVGKHLNLNQQQQQKSQKRTHNVETVNVSVCYPGDAGTIRRTANVPNHETDSVSVLCTEHGKGCRLRDGLCVEQYDGTNDTICLSTYAGNCQCNSSQVPAKEFGDFFHQATIIKRGMQKMSALTFFACWYEMTRNDNNIIHYYEAIEASNSLWLHREKWCNQGEDNYHGWMECPATVNIRKRRLLDAIVVALPTTSQHNSTFCETSERVKRHVQNELWKLHLRNNTRYLPVIFLRQSQGMKDAKECQQYWGGTNCLDGYRKEFFAQPFVFDDGTCLAIPPGYEDVYYFPAVKNGNKTTCLVGIPTEYHVSPRGSRNDLKAVICSGESGAMLVPGFASVVREDGILHLLGLLLIFFFVFQCVYKRCRSMK